MQEQQPEVGLFEADAAEMPLVAALLAYTRSGRQSWHMPGHLAGLAWPAWLSSAFASLDLTELPLTDDLNQPAGPAAQAMARAAECFGAGYTRFITGGSTTALQVLLAAAVGRRGRLLLPRCSHQSAVHAAAMLDLDVRWLNAGGYPPPDSDEPAPRLTMLPQTTAGDVRQALADHPDSQAILLTSPDYYGGCADLQAIARIAHQHNILLLVDEAHGAHLSFGGGLLPQSAMAAGADACVQSGHKTLPVLTQGAYLHVSAGAITGRRLCTADFDRLIPVFQTSSPSFPIAATLDYARACLDRYGRRLIEGQRACQAEFVTRLPAELFCQDWLAEPDRAGANGLSRDPLRLVVASRDTADLSLVEFLAGALAQAGIDIEFADLARLVLIPSLWQPVEFWRYLTDTLRKGVLSWHGRAPGPGHKPDRSRARLTLEEEWRRWLTIPGQAAMPAGEALFGGRRVEVLSLAKAYGRISARSLLPYPPGIPLIWPGERLDQARVDFLKQLSENKISISGMDQENLLVMA